MWLWISAHVYPAESLMASLFALLLAFAHCSCCWQLCWWRSYLQKRGDGSEEDSTEEELWCCVEPVLPAGLHELTGNSHRHCAPRWEMQRQRSVSMGQEPNRLKMFGAFLQGLERGKNLPPPSLAATTGERKLIAQVEEKESCWRWKQLLGWCGIQSLLCRILIAVGTMQSSAKGKDRSTGVCQRPIPISLVAFCSTFKERWSRKKTDRPQTCGDQQLPPKLGGILQLPVGRRDFCVTGAHAGSAAENTSWSNMWLLMTPPQHLVNLTFSFMCHYTASHGCTGS